MSDDLLSSLSGLLGNLGGGANAGQGGAQGGGAGDLLGALGGLLGGGGAGGSVQEVGQVAEHLHGALSQVPMTGQAQSIASIAGLAINFIPPDMLGKVRQFAPLIQMGLKATMGEVPPIVTGLLAAAAPGTLPTPTGNATGADIQSVLGALGALKGLAS